MALVVEDGSGMDDAESYGSVADCAAYATAHGLTFPSTENAATESALRRATAAIDALYRNRFPGTRTSGRSQALEWPRINATDNEGEIIASDEIPVEIVRACFEAAAREYDEANSMMPDLDRGGAIKRVKAGSVEVDYGGNASVNTAHQTIDGILAGLIGAANLYTARAVL